ncbi:MAG: SAM-dependent methyltransferase [Kineosporiaceae bacterium]
MDNGPDRGAAEGTEGDARAAAGRPGMDPHVPQSARVYDFLLGGKDNYPADRQVGAALIEAVPALPVMVRAQRAFLARVVRFLVRDAGVTQFLDIGTGIPAAGSVHEVAQAIAPGVHVVYVDNDPVVLTHARALMTGLPQGGTAFIEADVRRYTAIIEHDDLAGTLDRHRPIALLLVGILHHLQDVDDPYGIVSALVDWLPAGSHLVIAGPGSDFDPAAMAALARTAEQSGIPYVPRDREQTRRFFAGTQLIEPGVVPILGWRPDEGSEGVDVNSVFGWAGVGRKP